jgi:hypothetical protein
MPAVIQWGRYSKSWLAAPHDKQCKVVQNPEHRKSIHTIHATWSKCVWGNGQLTWGDHGIS